MSDWNDWQAEIDAPPMEPGSIQWPPKRNLTTDDLKALARGDHLRFVDSDGNELKMTTFLTSMQFFGTDGWHFGHWWDEPCVEACRIARGDKLPRVPAKANKHRYGR